MKGVHDKQGLENLEFILINNGGHDERTVKRAAERIERYGMQRYPRVRFDSEQFDTQVAATFGQYSYGYVVIDKDGVLLGIDVDKRELTDVIERACETTPLKFPLEGFALKVKVENVSGGSSGLFDRTGTLNGDKTGTLRFDFELPEGWHVSGGASDPPLVTVAYSGAIEVTEPKAPDSTKEGAAPPLTFSLRAPKGTPIGRHFLHGTVRIVACNDDGCLPPVDLPWQAVLVAL